MTDFPRLIERAFPLKQASLDSVHEKNVRHGHISTLHIWPARRPLAACRAALIATLLPDPGTPEARKELCEMLGGRVVQRVEKKKMPNGRTVERVKEETEGGILHWKREIENAETLEWFRQEIRKAYGGRAPRVLDPFAGGGAIPLEAMRLGCEVTAVDINPVAWFILKCTLEYSQNLAGKARPLPDFILDDEEFMASFYKVHPHLVGRTRVTQKQRSEFEGDLFRQSVANSVEVPEADLAWHLRAWGKWVLGRARRDLAGFYPMYADFEPIKPGRPYEKQVMRLVPLTEDGVPAVDSLNLESSEKYLGDDRNPRWLLKPTVAYLWARTVRCKNCRATVPLLKSLWLSKKGNKRTVLTMEPTPARDGVLFGVAREVPVVGTNPAQRREHDKKVGAGTMSRAGGQCPCCGVINTLEDIRLEGKAGRLGATPTAVMFDGRTRKDYRIPTAHERQCAEVAIETLDTVFAEVPYGLPTEPTPVGGGSGAGRAFSVQGYGLMRWCDLFTPRQLVALGTFVKHIRVAREAMRAQEYPAEWVETVGAFLALGFDRLADRSSSLCQPDPTPAQSGVIHTFHRFALPMNWDFIEGVTIEGSSGGFLPCLEWVARVVENAQKMEGAPSATVRCGSAVVDVARDADVALTDPPYYDAIPYSDLMDFFYVWLRRTLAGLSPEIDATFHARLAPKWDTETRDGELIDDSTRFGGDRNLSKEAYESGMARAFDACCRALRSDGRMVIVFAHKHPDAWETLASAMIRAGFVVDGSWPIQTEMGNRTRALTGAALASSVWLVCKKRPASAKPGWDNSVLEEMRANIKTSLREFWDAGIRGPDFVWSATGPALEAYSKHPVVRKANDPGKVMEVSEFLVHVRRMVVDFVVGQMLTGERGDADLAAADRMDAPTAYYLLHRHDFGMEDAPSGACILYATACGLSDRDLDATWDILAKAGGGAASERDDLHELEETDEDAEAEDTPSDSGSRVKLKEWSQRKSQTMGYEAPGGQPVPLIDRVHRLMHLWRAGEVIKVDEYIDEHGLRRHELFRRLLQSLIELSPAGSDERSLLESLSNHLHGKGALRERAPMLFRTEEIAEADTT